MHGSGKRVGVGLLWCWLALCCACAAQPTYEGARRARDEVAVVRGMSAWSPLDPGVSARVEAVDGVPVEGGATRVEILPGRHELVLYCRWQDQEARVTTEVVLEAGLAYVIAVGFDAAGRPDAVLVRADP